VPIQAFVVTACLNSALRSACERAIVVPSDNAVGIHDFESLNKVTSFTPSLEVLDF
jgi:hypothetical protein